MMNNKNLVYASGGQHAAAPYMRRLCWNMLQPFVPIDAILFLYYSFLLPTVLPFA